MDLPLRNSRIKLPSGQVFWREVGQGPILVFLHGSWSDSSQWLKVIEYLSQSYHCFAPDLMGFGESEQPQVHYSIQLEVECLFSFLEALQLSQVYLIGHSLGGWIAASYALQHGSQVKGLVLLAPEGVQTKEQQASWWWTRWLVSRPQLVYSLLKVFGFAAQIFGKGKLIDTLLKQQQQLLNSPTACQLLFGRRRAEIEAELLQEQLDNLKVPTLILQGRKDSSEAIARSQLYGESLAIAQLRMVDIAGNDLPEALPGLVAKHIHDFVRSY